ncbi:MAG TPA: hypothetical protein VK735_08315 [Pseudonocardia sp.]|uniref:sunset domain-containing protein n=1 Tax=Pseudonocardia sp. TaxID=60912 RepID=UPI002B8D06F4|nr:hypothetical protein [Pseudonocardia sp.]HTF47434.1 hypothetical protein [Pseudonocardia sp.]
MAKLMVGKRPLLLVLILVAAGLVAARSVRRGETPHFFTPPPEPDPSPAVAPAAERVAEAEPVAEPPAPAPAPANSRSAQPDLFSVATSPAPGPFPRSVLPLTDGSAPDPEFLVKGKINSMRSHGPSSPYYGRTRAEVWFRTEEDAIAAGFRPWAPKG